MSFILDLAKIKIGDLSRKIKDEHGTSIHHAHKVAKQQMILALLDEIKAEDESIAFQALHAAIVLLADDSDCPKG